MLRKGLNRGLSDVDFLFGTDMACSRIGDVYIYGVD